MVRRIHVAVKYWNLQSAHAKHYQTVHEVLNGRTYEKYIIKTHSTQMFSLVQNILIKALKG